MVANAAGGTDANGSVTVVKGLGGGVFQAQPEIPVNCGSNLCVPVAVAVTDFDHNGKLDVAVANNDGDSVSVLMGNGDLTFTAGGSGKVAAVPTAIVAEDFSGDGIADVAIASLLDNKVTVLIGAGNGTFVSPSSQLAQFGQAGDTTLVVVSASVFPTSGTVQVGDDRLNYTSKSGNTLTLVAPLAQNVATATAVSFVGVDIDVGSAPAGITAGNLNGDNKPDLVTANQDDDTVSVLINASAANMCVGDCNGDGMVTVDEILVMVNIALDPNNNPITLCAAGDSDHSNTITVDEILAAVNNALSECSGA